MARTTLERDGDRISVETGTGVITALEEGTGGRNVRVVLKALHLQDPVSGWLDKLALPDVYDLAFEAEMAGMAVDYRIEVRRRDGAPGPEVKAFEDLAPREKLRDLVRLTRTKGGRSTAQPGGPDRPASEAPGPAQAAPAPAPAPAAPPDSPAPGAVQARQEEDSPAPADGGGVGESAPPAPRPGPRPRLEEAKPWQMTNSDGSLNMGSYAYQAALGMVELAHKLYTDAGTVPSGGQVKALARTLLEVADEAQARIRRDARHDRMDNSHTRARGAVRTALEAHPVPWARPTEEQAAWRAALVERAAVLLEVASQLAVADLEAG